MANVLQGMQYVQQQGDLGRERGEQRRFRGLTPNALAGDFSAQTEQIALDPVAATQVQKAGDQQAKHLRGMAKYMQSALASGNPAQIQGAWKEISPSLGRLSGKPVPDIWDPSLEPGIHQALAKTAYLDEVNSETPSGFRQFQMTAAAAGLKPGTPEYQQAANIALGREGRAATGGFGFEVVEGLDGRKRLQRRNPRTGAVETYDEATGNFVPFGSPVGGMTGAAPATPPPREASGMPVVFDDPGVPPEVRAAIQSNPDSFGAAPDGTTARIGPQSPPRVSAMGVSRTPEEEAAAVEAAKLGATESFAPLTSDEVSRLGLPPGTFAQRNLRTGKVEFAPGAVQPKGLSPAKEAELAVKRQKAEDAKQDTVTTYDDGIRQIDQLLSSDKFDSLGTAMGDVQANIPYVRNDAKDARAALDTIKSRIVIDTLGKLKALSATGASGFGALSNQEAAILQNSMSSLDTAQSNEQLKQSLTDIKAIMKRTRDRLAGQGVSFPETESTGTQGAGGVDDLLSKYGVR